MNPNDFQTEWESDEPSTLVTFSPESVSQLALSEESKRLLVDVGLPEAAAPFLDFGGKTAHTLPTVDAVWKEGDSRQRIIGSNGYGDPICVHSDSGIVSFLLHDDEMKEQFMNSSLLQLAYTLLAFRRVVQRTNKEAGPGAYLEGRIPLEVSDEFIRTIDVIDPEAMKPERFWFTAVVK
jgi:hypothetical protein